MQQFTCECGNKIEVSGEQADIERHCTRCGRKIYLNDTDAKNEFSINDACPHPTPVKNEQCSGQPTQKTPRVSVMPQDANEYDPDATITRTNVTPGNFSRKNGDDSGFEPPSYQADDFVINAPHPTDDSGIGTLSSGSAVKYDLTKRVMRAIARPALPAVTFNGTGEYGIHRVLRVHQKGGMGRILVAYDQYLKREVAIKELHPDVAEDESIVRRFIGEAEVTAQLEHPGVVPIHRIGQGGDGLPYYTMKMVKGATLQDAIKTYHRKPSKPELLNLVRRLVSVSKTMAFAHSKGVIHRDLKPANIMLGEHGETLVMDWGLAKPYNQGVEDTYISIINQTKQTRPELTMVGSIVGTPAFMSPEQANAEDNIIGPLSDVFSLGTVLYYLLAGQTAFAGRSTQEVLSKVRACNPQPPSLVKPNVPRSLEAICLKAMAKLPENRYQGAAEFADDLCRWLDEEPVAADKDSLLSKIERWFSSCLRISWAAVFWVLVLSLVFSYIGVKLVQNRQPVVPPVAGEEIPTEFKKNIRVEESSGIEVWLNPRYTGELSLTCHVRASESEKHCCLSIFAPIGEFWDLSERNFLTFSLLEVHTADNATLQNFCIRLRSGESYYEYKPARELWESRNRSGWQPFTIPLRESHGDWVRGIVGEPTITNLERIEMHFDTEADMILIFDNFRFREE